MSVKALGAWDPSNECPAGLLSITKLMRHFMVSDTTRWSRDIYVEHIMDERQYMDPNSQKRQPAHHPNGSQPPQLYSTCCYLYLCTSLKTHLSATMPLPCAGGFSLFCKSCAFWLPLPLPHSTPRLSRLHSCYAT